MITNARPNTILAIIGAVTILTASSTPPAWTAVVAGSSETCGSTVSTAQPDPIDRITYRKEQMSNARLSPAQHPEGRA